MLSIARQHKLYAALSDFLGIIGYWADDFRAFEVRVISYGLARLQPATWLSATLVEPFYFRKDNFELYDISVIRLWAESQAVHGRSRACDPSII